MRILPGSSSASPACIEAREPTLKGIITDGLPLYPDPIAKGFGKEKLTAEQEKLVRDSIWMMVPKNVCVTCHLVQGHGEPATPKELITK